MPSLPLPTLSKKDGREYAAFDGGETNPHPPTLPPPHSLPHPPAHAQAGGGDSSNGGSSGGGAAAADMESADLSTCPADTHRRHALSVGGGENSFLRIGGDNEGLGRGRDGGRGRGCCWRMTRLQVLFVAVFGTCNLFLMADALGERRVLAWLEGMLVRDIRRGRKGGSERGRGRHEWRRAEARCAHLPSLSPSLPPSLPPSPDQCPSPHHVGNDGLAALLGLGDGVPRLPHHPTGGARRVCVQVRKERVREGGRLKARGRGRKLEMACPSVCV